MSAGQTPLDGLGRAQWGQVGTMFYIASVQLSVSMSTPCPAPGPLLPHPTEDREARTGQREGHLATGQQA